MKRTINCFIPYQDAAQAEQTVKGLKESNLVSQIYLLSTEAGVTGVTGMEGCVILPVQSLNSSETILSIASNADADYTLIYTKYTTLEMGMFALERMLHIADDSAAGMVYADHYIVTGQTRSNNPVIAYQQGSLRDDFNFGSVLIYNSEALKDAASRMDTTYHFAGMYDLRLKVSQLASLVHINEYLYSEVEQDNRKSGEKIFDYVDPKNRAVQVEMEGNIYLIREKDSNEAIENWLKRNYDKIFQNELNDWYTNEIKWPQQRTFKMFKEWFDYKIISMVLDMEETEITKD